MDLIKIEDIQNLKEGEVYFVNVYEEKRPRILDAIKQFNAEEPHDGDVSVEQANTPLCGPELCSPLVPFCLTVTLPNLPGGFVLQNLPFGFESSCVECIIEPCLLAGATVTNPCDPSGPPITGCEVAVNRVRAVGCIRVFLSAVFTPLCGSGIGVASNDETFCVNNVICFTCNDTPCPDFCTGIGAVITQGIFSNTPCGNDQITFIGFFVLPSCSI